MSQRDRGYYFQKTGKAGCQRGDSYMVGCVEFIDEKIEIFEALNTAKFSLSHLEISQRTKVRRSVVSLRKLLIS